MGTNKTEIHKKIELIVAIFAAIGGGYASYNIICILLEPEPQLILQLNERVSENHKSPECPKSTGSQKLLATAEFEPLADKVQLHFEGSAWLPNEECKGLHNESRVKMVGYHVYIKQCEGEQREYRLPYLVKGECGYSSVIIESSYVLRLDPTTKYQIELHLAVGSQAAKHDWVYITQSFSH